MVFSMPQGYDEAYYKHYDIGSKAVDYLESAELRKFHAGVARDVVAHFQPKTILDAGCAMGVLVSEFRKLGVDAYGIDYSEFAVTNADPIARPYCCQGSLADPFPEQLPGYFDLVTCMEVLEHMSPEDSKKAVANLCSVTDTVVFCSTPDDFEDPTHVNVQEREYWAALFAENGFFDDLMNRPLFMAPYAVCYRKREDWKEQIPVYERFVREADVQIRDFHDAHYRALEKEHEKAVSEWTRTANDYLNLQQHCQNISNLCKAKEEDLVSVKQQLLDSANQRIDLMNDCAAKDKRIADIQQCMEAERKQMEAEMEAAQNRIAEAEKNRQMLRQQLAETENARVRENEAFSCQLRDVQGLAAYYESRVAAYQSSTSWKVTAPFRFVTRNTKRFIGKSARRAYRVLKKIKNKSAAPVRKKIAKDLNWPPAQIAVNQMPPATVETDCRRLVVYTIFDKDGVVDRYILYFLKALSAWADRTVVVINGSVNKAGNTALREIGCEVVTRANSGFDAWGVKAGFEYVGYEKLQEYDEVIVANNTLFGPVSDLKEMFEAMAQRKVDFWGIASHAGFADFDPFGCNPYGYIPEHIQSFFYGIRKNMLSSAAFKRFWKELPELPDYNAAVGLYETVMTKYFTDAGFTWSCFMDRKDYYDMTDNPLIAMPMESIRDWKCPVFKRRAFFQDYDYLTSFTGQQSASCLMQYLEEATDYPVDMVWENLIRTCHMSDLSQNMHLSRIFDRNNDFAILDGSYELGAKAALIMHIYDHTMAAELAAYASSMPAESDIYISTTSEEKKSAIMEAFSGLPNRLEVRVLPNRGRDVSGLLASFKDIVMNYDVVCVTHDKKTGYLKPQTVGEGFAYMGYENILGSSQFVLQVLQAFDQDRRLGLLYAPDPSHADFATHIGLEWGPNFQCTKDLAAKLKLHVPMDENHPPMAPFGSSFWFRTKAMVPLFAKDWKYEDFPAEPFNQTDGSILHAIERIYPFVAQHAGFYSALLMTADYASVDVGNLYYYAQRYAHVCFENGIANRFITVRDLCDMQLSPAGTPVSVNTEVKMPGIIRRILNKVRPVLTRWAYE